VVRCGGIVALRIRKLLCGVSGKAHEASCGLEFLVLERETFELQTEKLLRLGGDVSADGCADRSAERGAECGARDGDQLLRGVLE